MLIPVTIVYVAIVVSAFMMLLVESVAANTNAGSTQEALMKKEKTKLPAPVRLALANAE
jgi:hypothetical protein